MKTHCKCGTKLEIGVNEYLDQRGICKPCAATRQKEYRKKRSKEYWITKDKKYSLKKRYGITPEEYKRLYLLQKGKCAICGVDPKALPTQRITLHVDHCHKTGLVRGLLCNGCNRALGFISDQSYIALAMANYLKQNEGKK